MLGCFAPSAMPLSPPSPLPAVSVDPVPSPALTEDGVIAALRRTWQPVANASDLPVGNIIGYTLLNTDLVVTRFTVFWSLAISPGFQGPPPEQQIEFAVRVLEEDRQMCELQIPREVPLNPARGGWGVLVMPGDTVATAFQKQFRRWLLAGANASSLVP